MSEGGQMGQSHYCGKDTQHSLPVLYTIFYQHHYDYHGDDGDDDYYYDGDDYSI